MPKEGKPKCLSCGDRYVLTGHDQVTYFTSSFDTQIYSFDYNHMSFGECIYISN